MSKLENRNQQMPWAAALTSQRQWTLTLSCMSRAMGWSSQGSVPYTSNAYPVLTLPPNLSQRSYTSSDFGPSQDSRTSRKPSKCFPLTHIRSEGQFHALSTGSFSDIISTFWSYSALLSSMNFILPSVITAATKLELANLCPLKAQESL